ncbi:MULTISPECIES: RING finger protein [Caproicibacterium]|uniref:RING finger protein n=1 Tax=Caproicibacterium argilliputei TaxID=3030016 RepID=A0AA97D6A6_9FIRM|nr:RING finger protein [Caproicibacterium argilliputei]WOC31076.1 RING finger protein [Caproicibacterium argilliputei]
MTDFTGVNCPVCNKPFHPGDDIVVCPVCGAPYHRACYKEVGHCVFEEKHGTAEAWQPPKTKAKAEESVRCPRCGHDNAPDALFCEHCGASLTSREEDSSAQNPNVGQSDSSFPGGFSPFGSGSQPNGWPYGSAPFVFDPMAGIDPDTTIDGEKAGDLAKVIQSNTTYYLPVFMNHEKYRKRRFNFAALLLGGGWLLYRKIYALGVAISTIALALEVAVQFFTAKFSSPILMRMMSDLGIAGTSSLNMAQLYRVAEKITLLPASQQFLFLLPNLLSLAIFIIHLVLGITANNLYRKHCVKTIRQIQTTLPNNSDLLIHYQEKGGVNTALLFIVLVCYLIANNSIYFML